MQAKITAPPQGLNIKLGGGLNVVIDGGKTQNYELTGDQVGVLEANGVKVVCPEREAAPPKGSKAALAAVAAKGKKGEA